MQYYSSLNATLVYIFAINDEAHRGCLKIGETTLDEATDGSLQPNSKALNAAARKRIDQYTKTAGISYQLLHTELTMSIHNGKFTNFNDKEVHNILLRSGVKRHSFSQKRQGTEWFECSLDTALKAIQAAKEKRSAIDPSDVREYEEPIVFRPEQQLAIDKTVTKFSRPGAVMLWNAKMRFGKTLSALQVVKERQFHRTIIITHRPVVDKGWFEDFGKIFSFLDGYRYGSREKGYKFEELERAAKKDPGSHYVYFASMQDLRGAQLAGGKFDKNAGIFKADYDLLIVDEAHEGTQTQLGQNVIKLLTKEKTCVLNLSGTPFNLLEDYREDEIYTWDYVMEQKAKAEWDRNHFGDPNPYAGLPKLNIFTFDLGKALGGFDDIEDAAFNFTEFFRTWTGDPEKDHRQMPEGMEGRFVHEEHVKSFIDLIVKYDETSNYPFSTEEFRGSFRHTLWMLPGVRQARALSALLQQHRIFGQFQIVNVAGDGDEEVENDDALNLVEKAMGNNPEDTRTITLSCGKLTTGVTVRPWTAVMMLAGSHNTDAKAYMQTIFRVQSPYTTKDGRRKENCYVFDFAPDRTLKVLAEAAKVGDRARSTATEGERVKLGEFLNFCPVIGYNGTRMESFNVERMLEQLKRAYISRVTKNGCDDPRLYNQEMLRKLDEEALARFKDLHAIIGQTKANHTSTDVDMAKTGLTNEQYKELERIKKKPKRELTEEDRRRIEEAKEKKKNADAAISILRGISIRLPLLMYGAELKDEGQDITLENFADLIDRQSWEEFMPRGVTKELFKEFAPYYDPDMFRAVGRNYRDLVRSADKLAPMERTREVARIFSYFRNPDKETVLTPWRVVNMHIGDCIGGRVFYDTDMQTELLKPRFVDHGEVTEKVFKDPDTRILEINSKTGLYPLYMAYSVFAEKLQAYRDSHMLATDVPIETQNEIWDEVLRDNIFVICKTEMAKSITKRTLRGFRKAKVNARYFEDLVNKITNQPDLFLMKVHNGINYWNNKELESDMKFSAVVGNPPYQVVVEGSNRSNSLYHLFIEIACKLDPVYVSMISPSRWMLRGAQSIPDSWIDKMLSCNHFIQIDDFIDASDCFSGVEIKGGVSYFLYSNSYNGKCCYRLHNHDSLSENNLYLNEGGLGIVIRDGKASAILKKVQHVEGNHYDSFDSLVSSQAFFGQDKTLNSNWTGFELEKSSTASIKCYLNKRLSSCGYGWMREEDVQKERASIYVNKVYISEAYGAGEGFPHQILGVPFYGESGSVCSKTYLVIGFDAQRHQFTKEQCFSIISYIKTKFFRFLVYIKKNTQHATRDVYSLVPVQDWSKPWTDAELYKKYHLTQDEIDYIESMIKPMGEEALFDTDDLIDPEFGSFDLAEHGVKPGDRITYTPTGAELTVAEGNKVICDGEEYTLAQFTAKYMPRNKRSVSGVCQGPKYFTYKGTSLYQMKESFLGGKK
ncbi:MAG: Eco57I restriction-modification methylase domain-containing protein [Bacteroidales bacterium]|nr:Eco57I restriction-modification methylase domain-containing protein [Bacteroidales bacterium]